MTFTLSETSITDAFKNDESIVEKSKEISNDIINEKYSIVDFIENLGFALTSPTVELRVNGTKLLSNTLSNLPDDYLNEKQLNFIVTFYCDRLKDHHNVIPAVLDGILVITKMKYLPNGSSEKLFRSFIQNTTCQSQLREDRYKFYLILDRICDRHYEELKAMKTDFIYGVINSIEGERDPRNLLFLFTFMPNFIKKFPLYHLSEELFETFACYFPIDFQPIKNDTNSITREQLADKLVNCLVASEEFIEWTIPLLNEKLGSDLITAKLDSLELLRRSAENFPEKKFDLHFDTIWNTLKPEIFPGNDNIEVYNAGLIALRSILKNAFNCPEISKNIQTTILCTILIHLSDDANHRLFEPASKIGLICIETNPIFASEKILNVLLIKLKKNLSKENAMVTGNDNDENDDDDDVNMGSSGIIRNLQTYEEENLKILMLLQKIFFILNQKNSLLKINLDLCKEIEIELMKILNKININHKLNENFIKIIINCITEFMPILTNANRIQFYKIFQEILCNDTNTIDIKEQIKKIYKYDKNELKLHLIDDILKNFKSYSPKIKEKIYKNLLILINTTTTNSNNDDNDGADGDHSHDNELENLILDLIITNIFVNLTNLIDYRVDEQKIALNALKEILINESENQKDQQQKNNRIIQKLHTDYNLIEKFINYVRVHNCNMNDENDDIRCALSNDLLEIISKILCLFIKQLSKDEQIILLDKYINESDNMINLSSISDLYLINGLIGNAHENVIQNMKDEQFENLLNNLIKLSLENASIAANNDNKMNENHDNDDCKQKLRKVCHHLLCSLLNKYDNSSAGSQINDKSHGILQNCIEKLKLEIYKNHNKYAIEILSWIIKGLLVQGHSEAVKLIEMLAELLEHPTLSNAACLGFEIISYELPELHLPIIKYLYKQKFFHIVLNKIWHKLTECSENHINAFVYVLKMTPHCVLKMNLEKIGSVLFKCLETENVTTVQITLEIFKQFLIEQDNYFRNHLNHLIPQLLKLTQIQHSMKIRISSIECLEVLTKYPTFILLPYKNDVVFGLISALDDKKRLVRNAAVKARNVWFLIG